MDEYPSFEVLKRSENTKTAFRVRIRELPGTIAVIAPHGGGIEQGTSEIAEAIAGNDFSFYAFEGLKPHNNNRLHITSTRFDEPQCIALVEASRHVLAIHGEKSGHEAIYIGGANDQMRSRISEALVKRGFPIMLNANPNLQGTDPLNICNRGKEGGGAQLELSKGFRKTLFKGLSACDRMITKPHFSEFVAAVRDGLK